MTRRLLAAALLAPALALGQTTTTVVGIAPSLQVSRLAPQLVAFAGGQTNFDNLVNGLALGTTVSLVTPLANGQAQVVTFTPQGTMTPTQIAQTLEAARQSLITRGIGTPTAQQVAVTLAGGLLPTPIGAAQVAGALPAANLPAATAGASDATGTVATVVTTPAVNSTPSPAALIQGQSGAGGTTPPSPAQIIQNQRGSNISDTPTTANTSNTPSAQTTTGPERPGTATGAVGAQTTGTTGVERRPTPAAPAK